MSNSRQGGEGGMGIVYAAQDERLDGRVARQTIRTTDPDEPARKQLWKEAGAQPTTTSLGNDLARLRERYVCGHVLLHHPWLESLRSHPDFSALRTRAAERSRHAQSVCLDNGGDRLLGVQMDRQPLTSR